MHVNIKKQSLCICFMHYFSILFFIFENAHYCLVCLLLSMPESFITPNVAASRLATLASKLRSITACGLFEVRNVGLQSSSRASSNSKKVRIEKSLSCVPLPTVVPISSRIRMSASTSGVTTVSSDSDLFLYVSLIFNSKESYLILLTDLFLVM